MQVSSSQLWVFNPLLLRLHGEISLSLLCSHRSWGSPLVLAPPLHVGCPQESLLCPDRRGLKQRLVRALLLTQAGGREGYGSHNWDAEQGCISRCWHDIETAWDTQCVLQGKLSLDLRTLAVVSCTGSGGGCR